MAMLIEFPNRELLKDVKVPVGKYYFGDPEDTLSARDWKYVQSQCLVPGLHEVTIRDSVLFIIAFLAKKKKAIARNRWTYFAVIPWNFLSSAKQRTCKSDTFTITDQGHLQLTLVESEPQESEEGVSYPKDEMFEILLHGNGKTCQAVISSYGVEVLIPRSSYTSRHYMPKIFN